MTSQKSISPRAWAELILLSAIWGGSFLAIRTALDEIPFVTSVAYRVAIAAAALWTVALIRRAPLGITRAHLVGFLGMGVLNNVIPFTLMAWGQLHIESGLTSILNATTAIFGVLVAAIFLADERLTPRKLIGVGIGFMGVATAIGLGTLMQFDLRSLAQVAVVTGTLSYALAGVWARHWLAGLSPLVAAAGMLSGASLVMIPAALFLDGAVVPQNPITWAAILYYALIATAFAYMLYFRVLGMAGSGNLMLCTLMVPPVAITLGAWIRDETLDPNAYAGFAALALGLVILDGRVMARLRARARARS
ncbi:multidrug transporter [Thalassobacter stenotrophicus]|uniref:DMT family transporter n=1 Tax=Thalassobacter TaxID=266808 RepID=UPI00051D7D7B|nr:MULTISPECIES: DMT family transporter [Thalassobacter]KGK79924.1 multidrug transporter [Thalassobacter stenotrophicus]KGL02573.1 multidrug transporter [Thalassobacter sp. 16PALIMAR09]